VKLHATGSRQYLAAFGQSTEQHCQTGDALLVLVPDPDIKAVESGWMQRCRAHNAGPHARLQFEGGRLAVRRLAEVAVDHFRSIVAFVMLPTTARASSVYLSSRQSHLPWPSERFLRQGGVNGWVLLNRVTMAYELWRQLNASSTDDDGNPASDLVRQKLK